MFGALVITLFTLFQGINSCVFVKLDDGLIKGRISLTPDEYKIFCAFQDIPYAAPPIGSLRFKSPQPVKKWHGILETTKNSKICHQVTANFEEENEDCLYLNVYTPKISRVGDDLPVMVFMHGGGFIIGSGVHSSYGPEFFMNHDVVIVTINYRLGPFGFLSTQDRLIPGNNGLKDQLLALKWVQRNIRKFGGDPAKVTIFGQSAGASSVAYHLLSPKSRGLFRAAILESGSALNPFAYQRDPRRYLIKTAAYLDANINQNSSSEEIVQLLRSVSASELDAASAQVVAEEYYDSVQLFQGYYYAPVLEVESEDAFLTEPMYEIIARGGASRVPIIMGINSEEGISQDTDEVFLAQLMSLYDIFPHLLVPNDMNVVTDKAVVGDRIRRLYNGDGLWQNNPTACIKFFSDNVFTRSVIKHAVLQSMYSNVYFYMFSYDGLIGNVSVIVQGAERVGHNEELGYLWRARNVQFDNYDLKIFPNNDLATSKRLLALWTNFAKNLNPTPKKSSLLQNIIWPKFSPVNLPFLNIGENLEIRNHPKRETFDGWNAIYDEFGNRPYDTY